MDSENIVEGVSEDAKIASENTMPRWRGRKPATVPEPFDTVLTDYATRLSRADMTEQARRSYLYRVRGYLVWLSAADIDGDPLTDRQAAMWAARDYKSYLFGTLKRAPATVNAALAAVSDLAMRRGLGVLSGSDVARVDRPVRRAPAALERRDDLRMQRAAQTATERDRALVFTMRFAGLRIAEVIGLDIDDLPTTQRRRRLRIRGKGRRQRFVPVHPILGEALDAWRARRTELPGADSPALFVNYRGGRLSTRAAATVVDHIAKAAGVAATPHTLRHTFADDLKRAGRNLPEIAELLGHASLDSTRIYTLPTTDDLAEAISNLTADQ